MESVQLTTADGLVLDGDIEQATDEHGAVVICHPHPAYGGSRFNPVVDRLFRVLPETGLTALRFDFRRGDGSGVGERLDLASAIDLLVDVVAGPVVLAGYSFGAAVALGSDDDRVAAIAAIAPPLSMMQVARPLVPVLVLAPRHDQFTDPEAAGPIVGAWKSARLEVVESADHFLVGHTRAVADRVGDWLAEHASAY